MRKNFPIEYTLLQFKKGITKLLSFSHFTAKTFDYVFSIESVSLLDCKLKNSTVHLYLLQWKFLKEIRSIAQLHYAQIKRSPE